MAYEAVPIDVEIQKVTAAERDALSRYKTHENINTFLGNENSPMLIGSVVLLIITPILIKLFWDAIESEIGNIFTPEQKMKVEVGFRGLLFASPATAPIILGKKLLSGDLGPKATGLLGPDVQSIVDWLTGDK